MMGPPTLQQKSFQVFVVNYEITISGMSSTGAESSDGTATSVDVDSSVGTESSAGAVSSVGTESSAGAESPTSSVSHNPRG